MSVSQALLKELDQLARTAEQCPVPHCDLIEAGARIQAIMVNEPMNKKQCAAFLGVSESTIDNWVRNIGLPKHQRKFSGKKRLGVVFFTREVAEWHLRYLSAVPERRSAGVRNMALLWGILTPLLANIYKYGLADGEPRFRVFINTKSIYFYETFDTLPLAIGARDRILDQGSSRRVRTLGEVVAIFHSSDALGGCAPG